MVNSNLVKTWLTLSSTTASDKPPLYTDNNRFLVSSHQTMYKTKDAIKDKFS